MSLTLTEPTTMGTDFLLALVCFAFAAWLRKREGARLMALAFAVTGTAALLGGTAHGFRIPLGTHWAIVWSATVGLITAGSLLLIVAGVRLSARSRSARRRDGLGCMKWAVVVTLAALAALVGNLSFHRHFNHYDLYHLIQLAGLVCLYRGSVLLSESDRLLESAH